MSKAKRDYFIACVEDGSLSMRPYCGGCGVQLNENYYCENCERQCRCTHIKCEDSDAYGLADALIKKNESFNNFTAEILVRPSKVNS